MIYLAVSTTNGCAYCIHSHAVAARAKGVTEQQHGELISVIDLEPVMDQLRVARPV